MFITPRDFTYNTQAGPGVYTLADQGLVALMAVDGSFCDSGFRIVTKPDWTMDVQPFMEAMAAICSYGTEDEGLSHNDLLMAKRRPLELRCGPTCEFVRISAASAGIVARTVYALNVTQPNGFDDAHVMTEARLDGHFALFECRTTASGRMPLVRCSR